MKMVLFVMATLLLNAIMAVGMTVALTASSTEVPTDVLISVCVWGAANVLAFALMADFMTSK